MLLRSGLFAAQVAAVAELLPIVRRSSADLATVIDALGAMPVTSPAAKGALAAIVAERFEPLFPIDLVEMNLRCAIEIAGSFEASLPLIERVAERFALARERGHGGENVTAIARLHG